MQADAARRVCGHVARNPRENQNSFGLQLIVHDQPPRRTIFLRSSLSARLGIMAPPLNWHHRSARYVARVRSIKLETFQRIFPDRRLYRSRSKKTIRLPRKTRRSSHVRTKRRSARFGIVFFDHRLSNMCVATITGLPLLNARLDRSPFAADDRHSSYGAFNAQVAAGNHD